MNNTTMINNTEYRVLSVSHSGDGDFDTLESACSFLLDSNIPTVLKIAPGTYRESIVFKCSNLVIEGMGQSPYDTVIADKHYAKEMNCDHVRGTFETAVLRTDGSNITIRNMTICNDVGSGKIYGQAVALYTDGMSQLVENCRIIAHQDTIFTAPFPLLNKHGLNEGFGPKGNMPRTPSTVTFRNCYIEGDVDFIFGGATALFENCEIFSHDALTEIDNPSVCRGYIAAPSTVAELEYGYLFLNCKLTSDAPENTVYLGRPWRPYGKAVYIGCSMGAHLKKELFNDWDDIANRTTAFFAISEDMYNSLGDEYISAIDHSFVKILSRRESEAYISGFMEFIKKNI